MSLKNEIQVTPPAARWSLNEVEAMGKRAARGAGLSWGLAEEAGKAARWLNAHGFPGVEQLADILTRNDNQNYAELAPVDTDGIWQAPAGRLCPLITGAALSDRATEIADGRVIELGRTSQPLLLVPYAAGVARLTGMIIAIGWDDVIMTLMPDREIIVGDRDMLTARSTDSVHCQCAGDVDEPVASVDGPIASVDELAAPAWSRLAAFAQRTFAPATEASRLSGAGAGLSDNDELD